jgi:hypothetical protein
VRGEAGANAHLRASCPRPGTKTQGFVYSATWTRSLPDRLRPVAVADRFRDFAARSSEWVTTQSRQMWLEAVAGIVFEIDLSTGAVRLTTSFTSASVPWSSGRGMEGPAGARNGARSPTDSSRSQPISISRKPLETVPHVVQQDRWRDLITRRSRVRIPPPLFHESPVNTGFSLFQECRQKGSKTALGQALGKVRSERGRFRPCAAPPVHLRSAARNAK